MNIFNLPRIIRSTKHALRMMWLFRPLQSSLNSKRIYINKKPASKGGPEVFVSKFSAELAKKDIAVSYNHIRDCKAALILITSPGKSFFSKAKRYGIRTIGRIGGFYVPAYFNANTYTPPYQDRRLTDEKKAFNKQLADDLSEYDHVIYQSTFTKNMCDQYLWKRNAAFSIIHNGVDTKRFYPSENKKGPLTLINAGTMRHEYIFNTLLPVFCELQKKITDIRLIIAGTMDTACSVIYDEYRYKYPELFQKQVTYLGAVPNDKLPEVYRMADIYIHPRAGDWSPNSMIEALASGLPVVCAQWGGQSELIADAGIAVTAKPWDYSQDYIHGFITATSTIIQDLQVYKTNARNHAQKNLTLEKMTQGYLKALAIP